MKRKIRFHVVEKDTGDVLSKHQKLRGPNSANVWLKAYQSNGFKAIIVYAPVEETKNECV